MKYIIILLNVIIFSACITAALDPFSAFSRGDFMNYPVLFLMVLVLNFLCFAAVNEWPPFSGNLPYYVIFLLAILSAVVGVIFFIGEIPLRWDKGNIPYIALAIMTIFYNLIQVLWYGVITSAEKLEKG